MSNLISHSKQRSAINLDNVASIFHEPGTSKHIWFEFAAMNDGCEMEVIWSFETEEVATAMHLNILNLYTNQLG